MSAGTTRHTIRIEDQLWNKAHAKATRHGTTVSELIREGLRNYVSDTAAGTPVSSRHTLADSLVYLVPDTLDDLHGPASGIVELPIHLDWGPNSRYLVDDDGSCSALYQLTLQNSGSIEEICGILNADRLTELWPSLRLPDRCRQAWEEAFPQLPTHRETKEHPSWTTLNG
ncbi:hypothetical protein [Arthrobacter sp. ISL-30]|uniref:hypothetical protein n=1 Tax=Arthrobacter sp. ISL-30 TaxID=2819109 RepID=UPI001BE7E905|nr:hypothetical protein [Arthrobacter sp. ISL-30]MBT2515655.1 hypothetical protein [Arthrobacter sp. ISL-30]